MPLGGDAMTRDIEKRLEKLERLEQSKLENWPPDEFDEDGNLTVFYLMGISGKPVRVTLDDFV